MPSRPSSFETSRTLKEVFNEQYEIWKRRNGEDLADLALKCGVSSAYLAHVRRYGRVPSKPVLILLAFNFGISGQKLFDAAGISERFPYESGLSIARPPTDDQGLFSFRFDSEGFTKVIRSIVRSEVRTRSPKDLLGSGPIRIGMNAHHYWLLGGDVQPKPGREKGVFPEFCKMLGLALQKEIQLVNIPFADYIEALSKGELDMFGPTMIVPNPPAEISFSTPLFKLGVSGLYRNRDIPELPKLPIPKKAEQLRDERYQIAVTKHALPHLIANTFLKRSDESLILCGSDDEAMDRVSLKGIRRPAHIFLLNSMSAYFASKNNPDLIMLYDTQKTFLDTADIAVAVRPDWPEVMPVINDAIRFVQTRGGLTEQLRLSFGSDTPSELFEIY